MGRSSGGRTIPEGGGPRSRGAREEAWGGSDMSADGPAWTEGRDGALRRVLHNDPLREAARAAETGSFVGSLPAGGYGPGRSAGAIPRRTSSMRSTASASTTRRRWRTPMPHSRGRPSVGGGVGGLRPGARTELVVALQRAQPLSPRPAPLSWRRRRGSWPCRRRCRRPSGHEFELLRPVVLERPHRRGLARPAPGLVRGATLLRAEHGGCLPPPASARRTPHRPRPVGGRAHRGTRTHQRRLGGRGGFLA